MLIFLTALLIFGPVLIMHGNSEELDVQSSVCCTEGLVAMREQGNAMDVILVQGAAVRSISDVCVSFSRVGLVQMFLNGEHVADMMCQRPNVLCDFVEGGSLRPSQRILSDFRLATNETVYEMEFKLMSNEKRPVATARALMHYWDAQDKVIVCDIDGTITKSNVRGIIDTVLTESYKHTHKGICNFLQQLARRYRIVFLTSRPLSLSNATRKFLHEVHQDNTNLPTGALLMNLSNLGSVLMSELFLKNMHKFKADLLIRHIVLPFAVALHSASPVQTSPFIAGFGNTITDTKAYDMVGIALSRIYQIGKDGSIVSHNAENSSSLATLPSTEQRKRNYSKLIGSKYQGYLDEQLLKDVEAHWTGLLSDDSVRSDSIPT